MGDDDVEGGGVGGDLLGLAGEELDPGIGSGQDGAHAVIGLDGGEMVDPFGQQAREDARAGTDLEDIRRILGKQPVDCLTRRS